MSLPPGQQRALESIAGRLAESDPRLVSLFRTFTRLNLAERMPWFEQVRVRPVYDRLARFGGWFRWVARRRAARARVRAMLLLPAALTAVACALTIAFGFPAARHVPGTRSPAAARELVVKSRALTMWRQCAMLRMPALTC